MCVYVIARSEKKTMSMREVERLFNAMARRRKHMQMRQMQTLFCYHLVEHWSHTNSKRRMRPIVNPQYRLLAIGTKEFPMDHLFLKKSDNF